jgi:hypothetical protein
MSVDADEMLFSQASQRGIRAFHCHRRSQSDAAEDHFASFFSPNHQSSVMVTDALRNEQLTGMPSKARPRRSVIEEIKHRLLPP